MTIGELIDHGSGDDTVSGCAMRWKAAEQAGLYGNVYVDRRTGEVLDSRVVAAAYARAVAAARARYEAERRRWLRRQHPKRDPRIRRMHSEYSRRRRHRRGT